MAFSLFNPLSPNSCCEVKFLMFWSFLIVLICMFTLRCKISNLDRSDREINTGGQICKQCQHGLRF